MKSLHHWHLVTPSPWPIFVSFSILFLVLAFVQYIHYFSLALLMIFISLGFVVSFAIFWWRDVIRESLLGYHSKAVKESLTFGFVLFIASEIMFFFGIFWTLFYYKLAPEIQIGGVWPPEAIYPLDPLKVPLLNTLVLVTSGVAITLVHHDMVEFSTHLVGLKRRKLVNFGTSFVVPSAPKKEENPFLLSFWSMRKTMRRKYPRNYALTDFVTTKPDILRKLEAVFTWGTFSSLTDRIGYMFILERMVDDYPITTSQNGMINVGFVKDKVNWLRIKNKKGLSFDIWQSLYMHDILIFFMITLLLAFAFTGLQLQEYWEASFQIMTSIYGSIFYFSTGFHGLHVIIGSIFLSVCFIRFYRYQYKSYPFEFSVGFWMAIWYWHFVDIVWLGLYVFLYVWGEPLDLYGSGHYWMGLIA